MRECLFFKHDLTKRKGTPLTRFIARASNSQKRSCTERGQRNNEQAGAQDHDSNFAFMVAAKGSARANTGRRPQSMYSNEIRPKGTWHLEPARGKTKWRSSRHSCRRDLYEFCWNPSLLFSWKCYRRFHLCHHNFTSEGYQSFTSSTKLMTSICRTLCVSSLNQWSQSFKIVHCSQMLILTKKSLWGEKPPEIITHHLGFTRSDFSEYKNLCVKKPLVMHEQI